MALPAHGRACLPRGRWATLRARAGDESGAILALTAITLVAFLGLAALAIDVGSFYQAQRQAQAAADAGALAGADALAGGASASAASTTATNMASTNYPSTTVPAVTVNGSSVTVNVANTSPAYFGRIFGITKENVGARAVAAGTPGASVPCSSPGNNCYAIFAMDTNCANDGVTFTGGGNTINGGVHSNGSIKNNGGGNIWGPTTYGPSANGCQVQNIGGGNTYSGGSPTSGPAISSWPIDYSLQYPACSAGGAIKCTGPQGTPSYCTTAAANFSFSTSPSAAPASPGIWCAYGSGSPSNPSTYTGSIAFTGGGMIVNGTFLAGTIGINGGGCSFTPDTTYKASNQLLFYATGTGTAVDLGGGGTSFSGDTFAPNGTIYVNSGGNHSTFLEGLDVSLNGGGMTLTGDGAPVTGTTSSSGTAALTQ